jgi:hypothetical protein
MSSWKQAWIAVETATVRDRLVQVCIVRYMRTAQNKMTSV